MHDIFALESVILKYWYIIQEKEHSKLQPYQCCVSSQL